MQMTAVYSCVRILAEAVAGLPIHVYEYTDSGGKEKAINHPLYHLLHDEPNPEMSSFVFRETLMTHLLLWGNAYAQVIRNGKNEVIALYPLMPNKMSVDRDANGQLYYTYYRGADEAIRDQEHTVTLMPSDVLHCEEYGAKFFANCAAPGGVLEHPGTIKDPQRVRESWQSTFGGSGNANKIAVLEEGMKYTPIGISPEQAQFLETRKFQINEIARIFRVPPHMVGDLEKSSFSNIEQQSLEFVKYTLDPWVIRWEQSIMRALLSPEEKASYFVKFNLEGLLRGDYQSRMNGYAIGRQNGWMSANDIRELENLDRIPAEEGGDLYLINGNMLPLKDAGAFANTPPTIAERRKNPMKKFWNWTNQTQTERTLHLNGTIAEESWFDDEVTPQLFKEELMSGSGDITVWINSPGGDCIAAAQIYNMLMDYANDGVVYQTLPWDHRGWHGGGSSNNTHIGVEMCEPACIRYTTGANFTCSDRADAVAAVERTYRAAVELFAMLCEQFGLDPLADGVIVSHREGHARGIASNHGDSEHLWRGLDLPYTMDTFRQAVYERMTGKEDDDMDVTRFKELWTQMRQELQDNDAGEYSKEARQWAVDNGIIHGGDSTQFNGMWQDMPTREQMVTVLYRFAQVIGKV